MSSDTHCPPEPLPPEELPGTSILIPPEVGETKLVRVRDQEVDKLTARRDCDSVTAMKRGLREYLEQAYLDVLGERVRFQRVFESHAASDVVAVYPAAAVIPTTEADYDYSSFTPVLDPANRVVDGTVPAGRSAYLVKYAEVSVGLGIELHCSSQEERISISMMLEDALNPVDWMYGFVLVLPHYYNVRASYEPANTQMTDGEDSARRRWRPGTIMLRAHIPLLRVRGLPGLEPRIQVEVEDGSA